MQGWGASFQLLLLGVKASWWDSQSATDLPLQRHWTESEQTPWGRDARDPSWACPWRAGSWGQASPARPFFSLPEPGSQGMQPQSNACGLERASPRQGGMSCGARRSLGCRGSLQRGHPCEASALPRASFPKPPVPWQSLPASSNAWETPKPLFPQ